MAREPEVEVLEMELKDLKAVEAEQVVRELEIEVADDLMFI